MMRLPNYSEDKSIEALRSENERLLSQADSMLEATGLLDVLADHGELSEIGGSYKYQLMSYPDIDLSIINIAADKASFAALVSRVVELEYVYKVATADTVNFQAATHADKRPKGFWLGIEIPFEGDRWGIDCWYQTNEWLGQGRDAYGEQLASIKTEQRDAILRIKYDLIKNKQYGSEYTSGDVYDAVIAEQATDYESFIKHRT